MPNEKPILFSTPMIQAIRDGRKSMTRRVTKPQPFNGEKCTYGGINTYGQHIFYPSRDEAYDDERDDGLRRSPYQVGDVLWVRETWYYESHMHELTAGEPDLPGGRYSHRYIYRASTPDYPVNVGVGEHGWKPSIFMPKEAARIFLRVTAVRAERLQDISEKDAKAEGMKPVTNNSGTMHRYEFRKLWDSLNAKPKPVYQRIDGKRVIVSYVSYPFADIRETRTYRGKPWQVIGNPYVFAYGFERIDQMPGVGA